MPLKIGELAKATDTQVVTIRYYEKEGLLRQPERTFFIIDIDFISLFN